MGYERTFNDAPRASTDVHIRTITVKDLLQALHEGYDDFNTRPSFWAFLAVVYPLFALLLVLLLRGENLMYLAFPVVAGFTLLGPVVSVALFEMSRRRELGLDLRWSSAFDFVHSRSFAPILALSIVMMVLYVGWLYMAQLIYLGLFGANPPGCVALNPAGDDPARRGLGRVWHRRGLHVRLCRVRLFGDLLPVAAR